MNEPTPGSQQARELYKRFSLALKSQTIDENGPGTILRDFQFVLNRIGEEGIPIGSSSRGFFPDKVAQEIDAHIGRIPERGIKRIRQPSCAHVQGLYLILRNSGLGVINEKGDTFEFIYDFGDCWQFKIKVEQIDEPNFAADKEPQLLEAKGIPPDQYQSGAGSDEW